MRQRSGAGCLLSLLTEVRINTSLYKLSYTLDRSVFVSYPKGTTNIHTALSLFRLFHALPKLKPFLLCSSFPFSSDPLFPLDTGPCPEPFSCSHQSCDKTLRRYHLDELPSLPTSFIVGDLAENAYVSSSGYQSRLPLPLTSWSHVLRNHRLFVFFLL